MSHNISSTIESPIPEPGRFLVSTDLKNLSKVDPIIFPYSYSEVTDADGSIFTVITISVPSGLNLIALSTKLEMARSIAALCISRMESPELVMSIVLPDLLENF